MLPIRLSNLALRAFGKYLSNILEKLATTSHDTSSEKFDCEILIPICLKLEEIIKKVVPNNLADQVTNSLMAEILKKYNNLEKQLRKGKKSHELRCWYKVITVKLCSTILHPSVKTLKFSRLQFPLVNRYDSRIFVDCFMNVIFKKLSNIRCLELEMYNFDENVFIEHVKLMKNLEELTFFGCTDAVMVAVCDFCKELRFLDLSNSKVTNSSVGSILKLKKLEHLKIQRTLIRGNGIETLFQEDSNFEVYNLMKSLYCMLDPHQVELIPKCFSNLSTLQFYVHENFSLIPLKELRNLSSLGIVLSVSHSQTSIDLHECLQSLGPQLITLKLRDFKEEEFIVIVRLIAENCTKLESLTLKVVPFYIDYEESDLISAADIPVMYSVQSCVLIASYTAMLKVILSKLVNVKEVKCVSYDGIMYERFMMELLSEMKEGKYGKLDVEGSSLCVSGENVIITKMNGSYVYVHWDYIDHALFKIMDCRTFDISAKCFQEVAKYSYG